jgi:Fic family protein
MAAPVHYHEGGFPPINIDWNVLIPLLGPAAAAVARYDGTLSAIPNAAILLSPLTTQEAVLSSRIEGTQATMDEVLEYEAGAAKKNLPAGREEDIHEVLNYRKAMRRAEELLRELPLCQRVIGETHQVLMSGVRGHNKAPGEYRRIPNWIGKNLPIPKLRTVSFSWRFFTRNLRRSILFSMAMAGWVECSSLCSCGKWA